MGTFFDRVSEKIHGPGRGATMLPTRASLASICCNMFKKKQVLQYVLEDLQKKDLEVTREGTSSQLILKNLF